MLYEYDWLNLIQTRKKKESEEEKEVHWDNQFSQSSSLWSPETEASLPWDQSLILSIRKTGNVVFVILHESPIKSCFPFPFSLSADRKSNGCVIFADLFQCGLKRLWPILCYSPTESLWLLVSVLLMLVLKGNIKSQEGKQKISYSHWVGFSQREQK